MKSALLICATLGAACCWALNDSLTTTNDVILDTRDTLPRLNSPFNNPPQIVNGEYITPLDHFLPTDRRKLLMVCKQVKRFIHMIQAIQWTDQKLTCRAIKRTCNS